MAKVLLAKSARGELVRKVQLALASQGFDPHGADGKFGSDTEAAVRAFQQARSFEPTGRVDVDTWTTLLGTRIPTTQERSLQLTAAFEGHGFTLAQGNFDGAGITWGIIGFTLKHGELAKIVLKVFDTNPALVQQSFGNNTEELIETLNSPKAVQLRFANSISIGTTKTAIKEPWRSGFRTFGELAEVQALQLELADRDYGQPAADMAKIFGLKTELGRALAFDTHVQNGGIKTSARKEIETALEETPVTSERELRIIIANAVADASTSFREDVRSRKLTVATGAGKVHGELFVLSNWGLEENPADS
jgi:peptidoglycan hydrolase-like protein with peptidoglycan-binding domain